MSRVGGPGLSGIQQRWQDDCSVDLQFGFGAKTFTFPYTSCSLPKAVLALAMRRAISSSNSADFERVLSR